MKSARERQAERNEAVRRRIAEEDARRNDWLKAECCGAPNPGILVASNRWAERHRNGHRRYPSLPAPVCEWALAHQAFQKREYYEKNPKMREAALAAARKLFGDPDHLAKRRERYRVRAANDPEWVKERGKRSLEYYRERSANDPEWMEKRAAKQRERREDPEYRQREIERGRQYRRDVKAAQQARLEKGA